MATRQKELVSNGQLSREHVAPRRQRCNLLKERLMLTELFSYFLRYNKDVGVQSMLEIKQGVTHKHVRERRGSPSRG